MSLEIERKFIVNTDKITTLGKGSHIVQGYLANNIKNSIRVRCVNEEGYLTIKSAGSTMVRSEFEYSIDLDDANYMLEYLCLDSLVEKTRYKLKYRQHDWVVDVFENNNKGLVLAEIELDSNSEEFEYPDWLLDEVTNNRRYYNSLLSKHPFSTWSSDSHHSS